MATIKAVLKSTARKTDATHLVMLRLTRHRKAVYIGLGVYVPKNLFNPQGTFDKGNWVLKKHDLWKEYNHSIKEEWRKLDRLCLDHPALSAAQLKDLLQKEGAGDLLSFFREEVERLTGKVRPNTATTYAVALQHLEAFCRGSLTLDVPFLHRYEAYLLQGEEGRARGRNSVTLYLDRLKTLTKRAVEHGLLPYADNPFHHFKLKHGKVQRDALSPEEVASLIAYRSTGARERARRVFLTQFFLSGMRVSDLLLLRWEQVQGERLEYRSQKTHALLSVKIPAPALEMMGEPGKGYIFGFLKEGMNEAARHRRLFVARAELNRELKRIATELKIQKVLSTHVARHSFASIAWTRTKDLKAIQHALGHAKLSMTEHYLRELTHQEQDALSEATFRDFV